MYLMRLAAPILAKIMQFLETINKVTLMSKRNIS